MRRGAGHDRYGAVSWPFSRYSAPAPQGPPMKRLAALVLTAALLAGLSPAAAGAQSWRDSYDGRPQDQARAAVEERRVVPLERIIEQISRRTPGQLLGASPPSNEGGRMIYRVLWDSRGRQLEYIIDARSGAILAVNGG